MGSTSYNASISYKIMAGLILFLITTSCQRRPDKVLSDSKMERFLADMMIADAYEQSAAGRNIPDSVRRNLGESIMKAHGIDYETLDSTYAWYSRNLDDYYKLYSRVEKRLEKQRKKIEGRSPLPETELQNDIWQLPQHLVFSPLGQGDALVFELPGETMGKGDRLEWRMHLSNGLESNMLLGVDYTDGSSNIAVRDYHGERDPKIKVVSDTAKEVHRIFGVFSVPRNVMPVYSDSIMLIKLPFDSVEYRNTWSQKQFNGLRPRVSKVMEKEDSDIDSAFASDSVKDKE